MAKCVTSPTAMCVSDSKCKPVFFDKDGRIVKSCKGERKRSMSVDPRLRLPDPVEMLRPKYVMNMENCFNFVGAQRRLVVLE